MIQLSKKDRTDKSLTDNLRAQGFAVNGQLATRTGGTGAKTRTRTAASIGKMTSANRDKYLNEAPVGTKIKGLYSKRSGREVTVEKQEGYLMAWDLGGNVGRRKDTYWTFNGSKEPYTASEIRKAFDGTSNYYTTKKKK